MLYRHIAWSMFSTWVNCAKMAEPIKMPFWGQIGVSPNNHGETRRILSGA